jgi:hypothetical protein
MRRRAYLSTGLALLGSLAGCTTERETAGGSPTGGPSTGTPTPTRTPGPTDAGSTRTADTDARYPVARSELTRGARKDGIPAIVDPEFGDSWDGLELDVESAFGGADTIQPQLHERDEVIGVARNGEARAYPLRLLNWHEICNDDFHGPLLVTYCPLCRTGVAAVRQVNGETTTFGVSGLLWKSNLVMYDELTGSLWSQVAATALRGEKAGSRLDLVTSTITGWGEWQEVHPDTEVLLPPPHSSTVVGDDALRNYNVNPYTQYENNDRIGISRTQHDERLHPKAIVVGITDAGEARAYPLSAVQEAGVVNDRVGELPVVVTTDGTGNLVAYERVVDGGKLRFHAVDDRTLMAGGSSWRRSTGEALDGPHEGTTLERANDRSPMFWFSWADVFPETGVFEPRTGTGTSTP